MKKSVHTNCIAMADYPEKAVASQRFDRAICPAIFSNVMAGNQRADAFGRPAVFRLIYSPETSFVFEHETRSALVNGN
jgi:hypothetical protein